MRAIHTHTHTHTPTNPHIQNHLSTHTHTHKHRFRNKMSPGIMYNDINIIMFNELPGDLLCIHYIILFIVIYLWLRNIQS